MNKETREIVERYLESIKNDVENMETNESPSIAEMWWNLALGNVAKLIEIYLEGLEEEE